MARKLLLLMNQLPHDPASGAAHSARTICELLAERGYEVRCLAITGTERAMDEPVIEYLNKVGVAPNIERERGGGARLRFEFRNVHYTLLDTGDHAVVGWEREHNDTFNELLASELRDFGPDVVFTYGGSPMDKERRAMCRASGAGIVFALFNFGYLNPEAFGDTDCLYACSQYVADRYRDEVGVESVAIPQPMHMDEVVAESHERIFVTYVNPSIEKGVFFAARLFEEIATRRPDIPMLTFEGRGTAGTLVGAGLAGGFDLRRHESVMISGPVARPRDIYEPARVLIAPSVWQEPAGRIAAEALVNGVPPIVSDRGGLHEVCAGGGYTLALPNDLLLESRQPVSAEHVAPWMQAIEALYDDATVYEQAVAQARDAGAAYAPEALGPRYEALMERAIETRLSKNE